MKQFFLIVLLLIIVAGGSFYLGREINNSPEEKSNQSVEMAVDNEEPIVIPTSTENNAELANPASSYCLKNGGQLEIVNNADGNGTIMCSMLTDYPEFSTYLIASCVDDSSGKLILR